MKKLTIEKKTGEKTEIITLNYITVNLTTENTIHIYTYELDIWVKVEDLRMLVLNDYNEEIAKGDNEEC